jgi:hypothetical protein
MPRVPGTATQGQQKVGAVPLATDVSTPFQSFTVPTPDFSGLRAISEAAVGTAAVFTKIRQDEQIKTDKRAAWAFGASITEHSNDLLLDPKNGLAALEGKAALETIKGDGTTNYSGVATTSLRALYAARLVDAKARASKGLSSDAIKDLDFIEAEANEKFSVAVDKAEIAAQKKVNLDITTSRISSAVEGAASAMGQSGWGSGDPRMRGFAISQALEEVKLAVIDPDIGLAVQSGIVDPGQIEELVRKSQALVYVRVIEEMISMGDTAGAMTLLDDQTRKGETLAGTPDAIRLNTAVLATRQSAQGKRIFAGIQAAHPADKIAQLNMILGIKNANQQSLALHEWKASNTLQNAVLKENVAREMGMLVAFMHKNPGITPDPKDFPALSRVHPRIIFEASSRVRRAATNIRMDAATAAHVAAGGSAVGNDTVVDNLSRMAKERPADFVKMMANPENVKIFTTASQWVQLQAKEITAKTAEMDATTGTVKYDSVLKDLGFIPTSRKYKNLIQNPLLHIALNDARKAVFEQTGKPASIRDDLMPVIAKFALPVDKTGSWNPTLYHMSEYSKQGTVDFETMLDTPLDLDKDRDLTPLHYALDRKVKPEDIRDIVDAHDGPITLRDIAEKIPGGVGVLKLDRWEQDRVDFNNAVLQLGFPPDFITAILDIQNNRQGLPHTEANAALVAAQLQAQPDAYKTQFVKWASGGTL